MFAGLILCTCGATLPPNASCGCEIGAPGGITACDGYTQAWPLKGEIDVASHTATFQVDVRLDGLGAPPMSWTPTGGSSSVPIDSEASLQDWKDDVGSTATIDYTVSLEVDELAIDMETAAGCAEEIHGTYCRFRATDGQTYVFDTVSDAGLPKPVVATSLAAVSRNANLSSTNFTPKQVDQDDYVETLLWPDSVSINYFEAFATVVAGDTEAYTRVRTLAQMTSPLLHTRSTTTFHDVPTTGSPLQYTHRWRTARADGLNLISAPFGFTNSAIVNGDVVMATGAHGGADDDVAEPPDGTETAICYATINAATTRTLTTADVAFRAGGFVWRASDRHETGGTTALLEQTSSVITAKTPSNPGCVDCPRWIRLTLVEKRYAAGDAGATPTVTTYDRILVQECTGRAGTPITGWPYACRWLEYRALPGDTGGGGTVELRRSGPVEWLLKGPSGEGHTVGLGLPVKWAGECPVGMADIIQTWAVFALAQTQVNTSTTTTFETGLTRLGRTVERILTVTTADEEECLGCACDEACDPCAHCLTAPESIGVHIHCERQEYNAEIDDYETVVGLDVTIALHRIEAQPCHYATAVGEGDEGWTGEIVKVDAVTDPDTEEVTDPAHYLLTLTKSGAGQVVLRAECGAFDITQLTWEIQSETISDVSGPCDVLTVEVG